MPRVKLQATTTQTVTTTVKLSPKARVMAKERCEEHTKLGKVVKDATARQKRIRVEVDALFTKEGQGRALLDGTDLDGYRLKLVEGKRKVFDQMGFMKKHGLSVEDFEDFTTYEPNEPYVKIGKAGDKDE